MKVAIIGAGGAGLCAGRHCLKENFTVDIFEQTGNVGGTWNYTDHIGIDENGIPVHSSMYKGLRTNLPKEVMAYEDFPYPEQEQSYLPQEQVLEYLKSYSKKFHIDDFVKFYKRVLKVEPREASWLIEVEDVKTKETSVGFYDSVMVCNGHYEDPYIPKDIPGIETFTGNIEHSHNYRKPDPYKNKKVLVIGAGPSGADIAHQISAVATKVYLTHRSGSLLPVLKKLDGDTAFFEDGSKAQIDEILLCTGYNYKFPFLSDKCGVKVKNNFVHPLFKHMISIEHPSLAFIGLPFIVCPFPLFDIQVRFFVSTLNGHYKLPFKEEMLAEFVKEKDQKCKLPLRKYHQLAEAQGDYFKDLANIARIKHVPPVIHKLYLHVRKRKNVNDCFRILDEEHWEQVR